MLCVLCSVCWAEMEGCANFQTCALLLGHAPLGCALLPGPLFPLPGLASFLEEKMCFPEGGMCCLLGRPCFLRPLLRPFATACLAYPVISASCRHQGMQRSPWRRREGARRKAKAKATQSHLWSTREEKAPPVGQAKRGRQARERRAGAKAHMRPPHGFHFCPALPICLLQDDSQCLACCVLPFGFIGLAQHFFFAHWMHRMRFFPG